MSNEEIESRRNAAYSAILKAHEAASALPKTRAQSVVLTKLDEARLWMMDVPHRDLELGK